MSFGFSRRNAIRQTHHQSRRSASKRRRLFFDSLEDRRLLSADTLNTTSPEAFSVPGSNITAPIMSPRSVATDNNGDTVVVWSNSPPTGSSAYSLYFELYAKVGSGASALLTPVAGGPLETTSGTPITNSTGASASAAALPVVAMAPTSGEFAVGWSDSSSTSTTNSAHVQLYSYTITTDGTTGGTSGTAAPMGNEILVGGSGKALMSQIAMTDQGFDVLYGTTGKGTIYLVDPTVERYTSTGAASGSPVTVAQLTSTGLAESSIAMDANGNFVVGWQYDIYQKKANDFKDTLNWQRFTNNGTAYGTIQPVVLGYYTGYPQHAPNLAMDANDDFVTVYDNPGLSTIEVTAGNVVEPPTLVYANVGGGGIHDPISMQSSGTYALSWAGTTVDPNGVTVWNVMADTFDLSGSALLQSPIIVDTLQSGEAFQGVSAAIDSSGDVAVVYGVWPSTGTGGGLFGDFYQDPPVTATTSTTTSSPTGAASPSGSSTAATDAVFAAYAYPEDDNSAL